MSRHFPRFVPAFVLVVAVMLVACHPSPEPAPTPLPIKPQPHPGPTQPYFNTWQEAVIAGRNDLTMLLADSLASGPPLLRDSAGSMQPWRTIPRFTLDFQKLLNADAHSQMRDLILEERNIVVPMFVGNKVLTVIEVVRDPQGWRVIGMNDQRVAREMAQLFTFTDHTTTQPIAFYEEPNLDLWIFGVKKPSGEVLYSRFASPTGDLMQTTWDGMFPGVDSVANEFQTNWVDSVANGNMIH